MLASAGIEELPLLQGDEYKTEVEQSSFDVWPLIKAFSKLQQWPSGQVICTQRMLLVRSKRLCLDACPTHIFWDKPHMYLDGALNAGLNFLKYSNCQSQKALILLPSTLMNVVHQNVLCFVPGMKAFIAQHIC